MKSRLKPDSYKKNLISKERKQKKKQYIKLLLEWLFQPPLPSPRNKCWCGDDISREERINSIYIYIHISINMDLEFGRPTVSRQLFYLCAEFTYWTVARDSILLNRKFTFSPPIHYNFLGFRASLSKTYYIYV